MRTITSILVLIATAGAGVSACSGSESAASAQENVSPPRTVLETEQGAPSRLVGTGLAATPARYDFGRVPINGGNVHTVFLVRNGGEAPVALSSVTTSCGCTTAFLEFADGSLLGPFGMPGHRVMTRLERSLDPGEEVRVKVIFDPAAHGPRGIGRVFREITVGTADGGGLKFGFDAEVVPG